MNCCATQVTQEDLNRRMSVRQLLQTQQELNNHLKFGEGWMAHLSPDHFITAMVAEFGELLDQPEGPAYKWWGTEKDPTLYSEWMTRLEIVDVVHFYLSTSILHIANSQECPTDDPYKQYDAIYVGADRHKNYPGAAIVWDPNVLVHTRFVDVVVAALAIRDKWDFFGWVDNLDFIVSASGMSSEVFSALYVAKAALNQARWDTRVTSGEYVKVNEEGVEDNERLFPLVETFLADPLLTLDDLREMVFDEFYDPAA